MTPYLRIDSQACAQLILYLLVTEQIEELHTLKVEVLNPILKNQSQHIQIALSPAFGLMETTINRTPPMLFTYNSEFRMDKANTEKRKEKLDRLLDLLVHYEIDADRVVYIGNDKNETRN